MNDDIVMTALVVLLAMIAGWLLTGLVMWTIAEWDERKWRKRMDEITREGFDRG